jgi:hypothetical protein
MKDTVSNSKLALCSTSTANFEQPANFIDWISGAGGDFFYIICKDIPRTLAAVVGYKQHYLCVFKPNSKDDLEEQEHVTGCKLRQDCDQPETHMLFSLIKPHNPKPYPDEEEASGDEYQSTLSLTKGPQDKSSKEGTIVTIFMALYNYMLSLHVKASCLVTCLRWYNKL